MIKVEWSNGTRKVLSVNRDLHNENAVKRIKVFPFSQIKASGMGNCQQNKHLPLSFQIPYKSCFI